MSKRSTRSRHGGERRRPRRLRTDGSAEGTERDQRRAARREQLLDAAERAVRRDGADVSMEAMAAEGGVSKPILYRHFGDRHGLVQAIGLRFMERLDTAVLGNLHDGAEADPRELLRSTVDAYLALVEDDTEIYRFLVRTVVSHEPDGADVLGAFLTAISSRIAVVISEQLASRKQDTGMAEPWAWAMVGAVHHAGDWWVERRTITRERLVEHLMALLWDGISAHTSR